VKPKLQWRPKEVVDSEDMDCLQRKDVGSEQRQSKRGHADCSRPGPRQGCPNPMELTPHHHMPQMLPDIGL
jgi:hypothetical protein